MTPVERICTENLTRPHGFEPLTLDGVLPGSLSGTLYRTGPGRFDSFGRPYLHLFEGDGALTAIRIAGGRAEGATRILPTTGLLEEQSAGRPLYGSAAPWLRRMLNVHAGRRKNTANTNVLCWQEQVLALMEAARPTRIDPSVLSVRGETDLGGVVRGPLCAHPHRVPQRGASYAYGVRYGRHTKLELYELPDCGPARHLGTFDLEAPPMLHDFIVTENHLVFFVPPAVASAPRLFLQLGSFEDLFQWRPQLGTFVLIVPIDRPDRPIKLETDPFFQWHFANAFEEPGRLFVDFLHYPDFSSFRAIGRNEVGGVRGGSYRRAEIDLAARSIALQPIFEPQADFPRVHPAVEASRHHYAWIVTETAPHRLLRLDVESGGFEAFAFDSHERASEAVIVPAGEGELEAFALTLVYDARRHATHLAVFDARSLAGGPIARAWFDHHIPITFHGTWSPMISS